MESSKTVARTGWGTGLTRISMAALLFEALTGFAVTLAPFHPMVEWGLLAHTLLGLATVVPITWYFAVHWASYRRYALSDTVLLGYVSGVALLVCSVSGLVVTWQGIAALRMSPLWRDVHLWSAVAGLVTGLVHIVLVWFRVRGRGTTRAGRLLGETVATTLVGVALLVGLALLYPGPHYVNAFPADYSYLYGPDRPFAPSLAKTSTGGAFDSRSLAGSESCGTSGCHTQILEEWKPSAHRYAARDVLFQGVQKVMAKQNGPESTRYCGGCHDPISLFSGTKNLYSEKLTGAQGQHEGISCLVCHAIRETDLQGNANYVITQPVSYLWQWDEKGAARWARDFLIRTYPDEHNLLSKRMFKAPEFCAACHKQFIDKEVNRVGWVQLQNQYDNWKASHWFVDGDPTKTVECRECHMPLVADSRDPAAGDAVDYNRSPDDGKHRSHRFVASNSMMPKLLKLEGWQKQAELTQEWLEGKFEIPEIRKKWAQGPIVKLVLEAPATAPAGKPIPLRVVLTSNKVGHDFPTGPLDIIQSWVEVEVTDQQGRVVYSSGARNEKNFIQPGSFLFKAEPVDQHGNLIDRHNLWEMVGVRYRRALFPGYSDTVEYLVDCPASVAPAPRPGEGSDTRHYELPKLEGHGRYQVEARLLYRKVDQYLINFLLGEDSGVTAPVVELDRDQATIEVGGASRAALAPAAGPPPAEPGG